MTDNVKEVLLTDPDGSELPLTGEQSQPEESTGRAEDETAVSDETSAKKKETLAQRAADNKAVTIISRILTVLFLVGCTVLGIMGWRQGVFSSVESLQAWVNSFGIWAPVIFIILQAVQVIIPIIPGGVTLICGVLLFGPWWGFVHNYIGICIGSFVVFAISRIYGRPLMYKLFKPELIEKYEHWTTKKGRFAKFFAVAIFLPGAPDGLICYLAGTTEMTWKVYSLIILLGKPASIAMYSVLCPLGINSISELISFFGK